MVSTDFTSIHRYTSLNQNAKYIFQLLTHILSKITIHETLIPNQPGIYRVLAPVGFKIQFTDCFENTAAPLYSPDLLAEKYSGCTDQEILYIGKANGRQGLRQRIKQYLNCGYGRGKNHKGGRAIWQIKEAGMLLIDYVP